MSHPPAVHVWATASHLYNNFFFETYCCCKKGLSSSTQSLGTRNGWLLCSHLEHQGRLDPKTSGDQLAFQAHLLHRWLQSPQAHGMHQQGSTHPVGQAEPCRFIFVDNPDLESVEPRVEERRRSSRDSLYKLFCLLDAMVMRLQADLD